MKKHIFEAARQLYHNLIAENNYADAHEYWPIILRAYGYDENEFIRYISENPRVQ